MQLDLLNLLLVLLAAWLAGNLAERLNYPSVLGELLAGIVLGPPLLGLLHGTEPLAILAELGVLLMMLYIGMEIDPRELGKVSWPGLLAAVGGFITPFVLAYVVVLRFGGTQVAALFVASVVGVTSLATKSRILVDLQILDMRIAHVLMVGALIADTLTLLAFAGIMGVVDVGALNLGAMGIVIGKAIAFFGLTALVGLKVFPWAGRRLSEAGLTGRTFHFTLVLLLAVLFAELAELAGLHAIVGAFIAGLFIRENVLGRSLSRELREAVREASIGFLAPIFFVTAGFAVSLRVFTGPDLAFFLTILGVAAVGKVLGSALFYLPSGHGWREGLTVGLGMNARGGVDIIVAGIGLEQGLISREIFSILVFTAIFTTASVPVLLRWGVEWLRGRGELVRSREERRGTLIVGGGPLARSVAAVLAEARPVWIVDSNLRRCERARAEGLRTVCGNALQEQVLSEAGAAQADSLLALTSNPEVNALVAQLGGDVFSIPEVHVVRMATPEDGGTDATLHHVGGTAAFGGPVQVEEWEEWIRHGRVERQLLAVPAEMKGEVLFRRLQEGGAALPVAVRDDGDLLPLHGSSRLSEAAEVVVLRLRPR